MQANKPLTSFAKQVGGTLGCMHDPDGKGMERSSNWLEIQPLYTAKAGSLPAIKFDGESMAKVVQEPAEAYALGTIGWGDEAVLRVSQLKNIAALDLQYSSVTSQGLRVLSSMGSLRSLKISQAELDGNSLRVLSKFPQLTALSLADCQVDAEGLSHLIASTSLRHLDLSNTRLDDAALAMLARLKSLESLRLFSNAITDKGLSYLIGHPSLRSLHLEFTQVTSDGIKLLPKISKLESLGLYVIGDNDLDELVRCTELKRLKCQGFQKVTDKGLQSLVKVEGLQEFSLSYSEITDEGVAALANLRNLSQLRLANCKITNKSLAALGNAGQLVMLELNQTECTERGLANLSNLEHLEEVKFLLNQGDGAGYSNLEKLKKLRNLELMPRYPVSGIMAAGIARVRTLEHLSINGSVNDEAIKVISGMSQLKFLALTSKTATEAGFRCIGKMRELRELHLSHGSINDRGLSHLSGLKNLEKLRFGFTQTTSEAAKKLAKAMPWCDTFPN